MKQYLMLGLGERDASHRTLLDTVSILASHAEQVERSLRVELRKISESRRATNF
jgi:hypothetical protein